MKLQMGLKYGFPSEDIVTGIAIQCRGWKSIYFNPVRKGFLGVAPTTLLQSLVQHKRWSEGQFLIGVSECSPFIYGHGRIPIQLQLSYIPYIFWSPNFLPTLYYIAVPSLCLFRAVSLFPKVTSLWFLPFAYIVITSYSYSLGEFLCCGGTLQGWWNEQRMWVFRRTSSYFFAFLETILKLTGFAKSGFVVTAKVADEDVLQRFMRDEMEFGAPSPMFTLLATLAVLNLFTFTWTLAKVVMDWEIMVLEPLALQVVLCGLVVLINLPVYQGLFFRKDNGKMPASVTSKSVIVSHTPAQGDFRRPAWIGMFMAELWFSFFWFINQSVRWNPIRRYTFKEKLYQRSLSPTLLVQFA
ncbi:hypothetical protein RJ640_010200 [Escallonia rubra]|uniref:Cellulose synthase-like protein n=1 Tax=Escallonia rubra TaxID=112253 RepID=A0AA88UJB8_9ASTE|nr:hypothetical protein RJ640_010200 [Escallonia rubra]